jgi:hypothetical protein
MFRHDVALLQVLYHLLLLRILLVSQLGNILSLDLVFFLYFDCS